MPTGGLILNDAGATAAHLFSLQLDGLDVTKEAGSPGSLFGTLVDSIRLVDSFTEVPSLEFEVDDPGAELAPAKGANVYFVDHRGIRSAAGVYSENDLFRGILVSARKVEDGAVGIRWRMYALGLATLLDRNVLVEGVIPAGTVPASAIQQVTSTLDPRISALRDQANALGVNPTAGANNLIGGPATGTLVAVPLAGKTYRKALADIAAATVSTVWVGSYQGNDLVDVTTQGRIRWSPQHAFLNHVVTGFRELAYASSAVAPYDVLADERNLIDAVSRVWVRGVDTASSGWVTLAESQYIQGMPSAYLEAPECTSSTIRDNIGQVYLRKHLPGTQATYTVSGSHADVHQLPLAAEYRGYGVRQFVVVTSRFYAGGVQDLVTKLERSWSGGGTAPMIRITSSPSSANGGFTTGGGTAAMQQTITATDDRARAANRLQGTLSEVAIRSKAGVPSDADFDTARDGFMVLDTTNDVLWTRSGGIWRPSQGYQYAYTEFTANVPVVGLTSGTADVVVTSASVTYDGDTPVYVEFFSPDMRPDTTAIARNISVLLFEDGVDIGIMGTNYTPAASSDRKAMFATRRLTPTAGAHTYSIRAMVSAITGNVGAGAGGVGALVPGFIRIVRA